MALYSKKLTEEEMRLAKEDLNEVRNIRGKILDYMSTLEYVLWILINKNLYKKHKDKLKITRDFKKLGLKEKVKIFIEEHKELGTANIDDLEKSILKAVNWRNSWAHGFIFYEKFEIDKTDGKKKPINYIFSPHKDGFKFTPIHFKTDYFNVVRFHIPFIMNWLEKNGISKKVEIEIDLKNKRVITD